MKVNEIPEGYRYRFQDLSFSRGIFPAGQGVQAADVAPPAENYPAARLDLLPRTL